MTDWFTESLHPYIGQKLKIERVICQITTEFQELLIFENKFFGKVLVLDGIIQITERDEFIYHEMLSHVPIMFHDNPSDLLIIGGGDGGILREVLKHRSVQKVVMVELDPIVVENCKHFFPEVSRGAFDDPRLQLIIGDGLDYVSTTQNRHDIIIVDSPDPIGPASKLFSSNFYQNCRRILSKNGILVTQNGVPFFQRDELLSSTRRLKKYFEDVTIYRAPIPTYQGGDMAFGWATSSQDLRATPREELSRRFTASSITTSYYDPAIHMTAFLLPKWISELLV